MMGIDLVLTGTVLPIMQHSRSPRIIVERGEEGECGGRGVGEAEIIASPTSPPFVERRTGNFAFIMSTVLFKTTLFMMGWNVSNLCQPRN